MKNRVCFFIMISFSFLLISCTNETEKVESPSPPSIQSPLVIKNNEQKFKIINYYKEYLDFLNAAKNQPNDIEELYKQTVVSALRDDGFGYDEISWIFSRPKDIATMKENIDSLIDKQDLINETIIEALKKSADQLPGGDKKVYVVPANPDFTAAMSEMKYVAGFTLNKNTILIVIDPSFEKEDLEYTVAHEYHHAIYMAIDKAKWFTMLELFVFEGKADTFAKTLYPNAQIAWIEPLAERDEVEMWNTFRQNLNSTDSSLMADFHSGNRRKDIPKWTKYKIGFQIMKSFIEENPDVSIEEWTHMPAEEIFLSSKYKDN